MNFFISRQRVGGGVVRVGNRVADGNVFYALDACRYIADFARRKGAFGYEMRVERSDFRNVELFASVKGFNSRAYAYRSVHYTNETDYALEVVVITVEYKG